MKTATRISFISKVCIFLILCVLGVKYFGSSETSSLATPVTPLSRSDVQKEYADEFGAGSLLHAREMLQGYFGDDAPFRGLSPEQLAKRLNYVVYNHCESTQPHTGQKDINELFSECRTACGGYAYVLRSLLAAHDIRTRYLNLYNLPQQGNHVMVEVEIAPRQWALFDPTFGSFFTGDGRSQSTPLSFQDIRFQLRIDSIEQNSLVARKGDVSLGAEDELLYDSNSFNFKYMEIENYLLAEAYAPVKEGLTVPLTLSMNLKNGVDEAGTLAPVSVGEGEAEFLRWTNATLNDDVENNDTSYLFSMLGNYKPYFESLNILKFDGLSADMSYEISIAGNSSHNEASVQIVDIGNDVYMDTIEADIVADGHFEVKRKFIAKSSSASFVIRLIEPKDSFVRVFGVSISEQ